MTAPVFYLPDAAASGPGQRVVLGGAEGRHAADVRRLRVGESVCLTDGAGIELTGQVSGVRRGAIDVDVHERTVAARRAPVLVVAQALAKGGRDEAAVEAMTETGVDEIVPWPADRSVARWTDRSAHRWQATVAAAAKQSRRSWWPVVAQPATTRELAARCAEADVALVLHEAATHGLPVLSSPRDVLVVVGPEGGITEGELAALTAAGALAVRLGDTILRSSTAGVVALAAIAAATRWHR